MDILTFIIEWSRVYIIINLNSNNAYCLLQSYIFYLHLYTLQYTQLDNEIQLVLHVKQSSLCEACNVNTL